MRLASLVSLALLTATNAAHAVQPTRATDYAVLSSGNVTLASYSTVLGPVYSGGNTFLDFGYGIQRPSQNSGDFYSRGSLTVDSLSDVEGDIFANQNVTLLGSADVDGNIVYGTTFTPSSSSSSNVTGTVTMQAGSVAAVSLPPATTFSAGFFDAIYDEDFTLAPGSYGAVQQNGLFQSVHLTSGTYTMQSLALDGSTSLYLDFVGTQPIKVLVKDDIFIGSGFSVFVNGVEMGNGNNGLQTGYAALTLFETHGDFTIEPGFLNYFYGTIFAPAGRVTMDVQDMFGSILASGPIEGNAYISLRASQLLASSTPLQGDFTGDGQVNGADLARWRTYAGQANATIGHDHGDADGDHDVDGADFLIWQRRLGTSATAAAVPEPSAALACLAAVPAAMTFRRRCRHPGLGS